MSPSVGTIRIRLVGFSQKLAAVLKDLRGYPTFTAPPPIVAPGAKEMAAPPIEVVSLGLPSRERDQ